MTEIKNLTELHEKLNSGGKVLLDFYAPWCGPCRMMEPTLNKFSADNEDVEVIKVNVDVAQDVAAVFQIRSIPTLITYNNGEAIKKYIGGLSSSDLVEIKSDYE